MIGGDAAAGFGVRTPASRGGMRVHEHLLEGSGSLPGAAAVEVAPVQLDRLLPEFRPIQISSSSAAENRAYTNIVLLDEPLGMAPAAGGKKSPRTCTTTNCVSITGVTSKPGSKNTSIQRQSQGAISFQWVAGPRCQVPPRPAAPPPCGVVARGGGRPAHGR